MNNKEFISSLSKRTGYKTDDTQRMVRTSVNAVIELLTAGENVTIARLGSFDVKKRLERVINNPGTGQRMLVPPKLVVNFKPLSSVKDSMNNLE